MSSEDYQIEEHLSPESSAPALRSRRLGGEFSSQVITAEALRPPRLRREKPAELWYIVSVPNASVPERPSHRRQNSFAIANSGSWLRPSLDWLLVFVPVAIVVRFVPALHNSTALFIVACLAVIPLAAWMGRSTEHLAKHLGSGVGSLLNATFGNAAELIIALFAIAKGLEGVVKASITGSIIGNLLLVLGFSFFSGGIKFTKQEFNRTVASASASALTLAAIGLTIPTIFHQAAANVPVQSGGWTILREQQLSLAIAVVLFLTYIATLIFSLVTHRSLFAGEAHEGNESSQEYAATWGMKRAAIALAATTALVALMSEFLVGAIEQARARLGLTEVFVGVIVVAIIGNAAEHSSAVLMARRNKMDLSIGIALGSSMQIALFVAPVLIFASYLFG
ncbi:MAG TPA: calcium/proton exchanger, partial [Pyrinomonadaceae bacterium]|nr:calcium/proton exchanger [Pyrinomonadaceae bacterium]